MRRALSGLLLAAIAAALVAGLLWWRSPGAEPTDGLVTTAGRRRAGSRPGLAPPGTGPEQIGQPGAPARRVSGRVRFEGAPVEGATVALVVLGGEAGLAPPLLLRTDAAGRFDFGPRPATLHAVTASTPGRTPARRVLDLRDPTARPASDQLELALTPCSDQVSGTISDASGGAEAVVAGARVSSGEQPGDGIQTESDARGRYQLCVPRGWGSLRVDATGYGARLASLRIEGQVQHDVQLTPEAVVVGRTVAAEDGAPIAGALVELNATLDGLRQPAPQSGVSDADGRFKLGGAAAGQVRLVASGAGRASSAAADIVLLAGRTSAEIVLRLPAATRLSGVVLEGGKPVAGATVKALPATGIPENGGGFRSRRGQRAGQPPTAISQADGRFVLENVAQGAVTLEASPYEVQSPRGLTVGQKEMTDVQVDVTPLGTLRGRLTRRGAPVEGANVSTWANGAGYRSATSQADGQYELRGLPPGTYTLQAESHAEGAFGSSAPATLTKGQTRDNVDIDLGFAASIAGEVVEPDGTPVVGVHVRWQEVDGRDQGTATSGTDGRFRATQLEGGKTYAATVRTAPLSPQRLHPADPAGFPTVNVGGASTRIEGIRLVVRLDRLQIAGRVVDAAGQPRADVHLVATPGEGPRWSRYTRWADLPSSTSDGQGAFLMSGLQAGRWTLEARADDGAIATVKGVNAGQKDVVVTLAAAGGLDGTLVGFSQAPEVHVQPQDQSATLRPESDGKSFRLRGLKAGRYVVTASAGADGDSASVTVGAGEVASITLRSRGSARLNGQVTEWRSRAGVAGLRCTATLQHGEDSGPSLVAATAFTDGGGRFEVGPVPAGRLQVRCSGAGYTEGVSTVSPSGGETARLELWVVSKPEGPPAARLGVWFDDRAADRARISRVVDGGPAQKAGLQTGDVLTAVDGADVTALGKDAIAYAVTDRPPGTVVALTLQRGESTLTLSVPLGTP